MRHSFLCFFSLVYAFPNFCSQISRPLACGVRVSSKASAAADNGALLRRFRLQRSENNGVFFFVPQGIPGRPGARGDPGPQGDRVSPKPDASGAPRFIRKSNGMLAYQTCRGYSGYDAMARRYQLHFRVVKTICYHHEKIKFISASRRVSFLLLYRQALACHFQPCISGKWRHRYTSYISL